MPNLIKLLNTFRQHGYASLLLLAVVLVYLPFLNNPLVFDDLSFFRQAIHIYADAIFHFDLRWFSYSTLGFTWVFFGESPVVFRLQNLLLHGLNVLLLWHVLRIWLALFVSGGDQREIMYRGAWLGALVFACHPLAVYGVGYLVQRSILMATLFTLLMQLAYLKGVLKNNWRYMVAAVLAYFLAVFSKEHSLMAPAILLPITWVIRAQVKLSARALIATWLALGVVGLLVLLRIKGVLGQPYEPYAMAMFEEQGLLLEQPRLHLLSVLTQSGLFFKYCLLMVVPNPAWMSIDVRMPFILTWQNWTSWIGLVAFMAYGLLSLLCLLRGGRIALLGIALLYPWCYFWVELSSIRVQEIFVLYRSYLWLPGYMLLLPLLLGALPGRKILLAGLLAVLVLVPLAWNRLWVLGDHYRLWDDAVYLLHGKDTLGAHRIYYGRGQASSAKKDWQAAIADFKKALSIQPSYPQASMALTAAYMDAGQLEHALSLSEQMIAADPKNAHAYYAKATVLSKLRDKAGSIKQMEKSCELGMNLACLMVTVSKPKAE